jgi:hypothetical protein
MGRNDGLRLPLSKYFELTANAYRGQALAGLGGGGYVNYYAYFYEGRMSMCTRWTTLAAGRN